MSMKTHILAALREEYEQWVRLLDSLSETQITTPLEVNEWSIKDIVTHLWAWQQRSIARNEGAMLNHEPVFPDWPSDVNPDAEGAADVINAWIYATYHNEPWAAIYHKWRSGFQRLLDLAAEIDELDLLNTDRYPWLNGYSVALILLASYEHHQEHFEILQAWFAHHGQL